MPECIATFYTHAGAIVAHRALTQAGIDARMMPVPRRISSSCGTCVRYAAETPDAALFTQDFEALYLVEGRQYVKLLEAEDPS